MNLNFDRATRARIHAALLDVMPGKQPVVEEAFAEAVAWADTDGIGDLGEVLELAARIDFHVYRAVYRSGCDHAEVDATSLNELYTPGTIRLGMRLAGYGTRVSARDMRWTDAPGNEPTIKVVLKAEDFEIG